METVKMLTFAQIRSYGWYLFGIMGVVFFWAGVWDGAGNLGPLQKPWVSLLVGLAMLTFSGFIFKRAGPFGVGERSVESVIRQVHRHPRKEEFHIKYLDKIKGKHLLLKADGLKEIEKEFLIFLDKGNKEIFIPLHRVTEILHQGKTHWKT